ncbi:molybdopterin cofactor-binding domain-containing protein [Pseudofrankia sp. BMG5.36]|uniref:xanthine dehydrogenase family protein molybdopterin-binding subunit n=1 Tax=Pseudofrankia sp. BMG5.36 TaxID=1834512 RepID=UPI0008D9B4D6|nr:molybdopterin cofactor-binding domain-containing protein [Pseudofrankia sp. BMG5.36]OHV46556.1 hypothetical protein BCD48_20760 [Pseudofrankia sp. BMG5.36]
MAKLTGRFRYATDLRARDVLGRRAPSRLGDQARHAGATADSPGENAAVTAPAELYGVTVRSPVARAELLGVDAAAALAVPGAMRVIIAADVPGARLVGVKVRDQPVFAEGEVRHHGEPIAFAVATTPWAARRMAALVRPLLRPLPPLVDPLAALAPGAPAVVPAGHPHAAPGGDVHGAHAADGAVSPNVIFRRRLRHGDGARGPVAVRARWRTGRQDPAFLAPEAGLAVPDGRGGVRLWVATQDLHHDRDQIAAALGVPPEAVRVELAGVGGAFGGREDMTLHIHLCLAAVLTGAPVRAVYGRAESFQAHPSRHPAIMDYELTARPDGTFVSLRAGIVLDGGPYASTSTPVVGIVHFFAAGPYQVPNVDVTTTAVRTNNPVAGAMRGFGATQASFGIESTVDLLARELGVDPVDLRRRNLLVPGEPLATSGQPLVGTAGPAEVLAACLATPMPARPVAPGRRRGVGVALGIKSAGLGDGRPDSAGIVLRADRDGVTIVSAAPEVGQGIGTALRQIVQEQLGPVPLRAEAPSTDAPVSGGSKASRQTMASGGAAAAAASRLLAELTTRAHAHGLPCWPAAGGPDGRWPATGPLTDLLAAVLGDETVEVRESYTLPATEPVNPATGRGDIHITFQLTAHRAVVDVDPELGTAELVQLVGAQDVGRAVNPTQLAGQLVGGAAQGAGLALTEEIRVDADGVATAAGFADYLVPTALDVPEIVPVVIEHPDDRLPHGIRGVGEGSLASSPAAVAAALRAASGRPVAAVPAAPADLLAEPVAVPHAVGV